MIYKGGMPTSMICAALSASMIYPNLWFGKRKIRNTLTGIPYFWLMVNYTIKCNTFKKKRTLILNPVL